MKIAVNIAKIILAASKNNNKAVHLNKGLLTTCLEEDIPDLEFPHEVVLKLIEILQLY